MIEVKNEIMDDKTLSAVIWSWGILFGVIGFLIIFAGGLFGYIFRVHRADNDSEHQEMREDLKEIDKTLTILKTQHETEHCRK